jgi:hypothetical protein
MTGINEQIKVFSVPIRYRTSMVFASDFVFGIIVLNYAQNTTTTILVYQSHILHFMFLLSEISTANRNLKV